MTKPEYGIDCCPMTGEKDCARCSGEYCEFHFDKPCECGVEERHGLGEEDLRRDLYDVPN